MTRVCRVCRPRRWRCRCRCVARKWLRRRESGEGSSGSTGRWKREWATKRAGERVKEAQEAEFCVYACRCRRCRRCRPCPALRPSPIRSSVVLRQGTPALKYTERSTANTPRMHREYTAIANLPTCSFPVHTARPRRAERLALAFVARSTSFGLTT